MSPPTCGPQLHSIALTVTLPIYAGHLYVIRHLYATSFGSARYQCVASNASMHQHINKHTCAATNAGIMAHFAYPHQSFIQMRCAIVLSHTESISACSARYAAKWVFCEMVCRGKNTLNTRSLTMCNYMPTCA